MSSSSSSSSSSPYFCPRCGDQCRFSSVPDLRVHSVSRHTYETSSVSSQARVKGSRPGALLPLPGPTVSQSESSSSSVDAHGFPLPLACLDSASPQDSVQMLREMFSPPDRASPPPPARGGEPSTASVLPGSSESVPGKKISDVGVSGSDFRSSVDIGSEERSGSGSDHKIARTFAEVEERVNRRVARLKAELQKREAELVRKRRARERSRREKKEVEERAAYSSRQVSAAMEMMERSKTNLAEKETESSERQQEMADIELFSRQTAEKEAEAKSRSQVFIETSSERADRAERQSSSLNQNHFTHDDDSGRFGYDEPYSPSEAYSPVPGRAGRSSDGSADDIIANKMQESLGNRRSYSVSGSYRSGEHMHGHHHYSGSNEQMRTLSSGSGGWDCEGGSVHLHASHYSPHWTPQETERFRQRERVWVGEEGWGRTWSKRNIRHHSTEEEEEEDEEDSWSSTEMKHLIFARKRTPGTDTPSSVGSTPSRYHGNRQPGADTSRMRAGLFCVFPYLDVCSSSRAAEVCRDWRFVARHPAVWTRLRSENARVSAEFLQTVSQWCTQTQSSILNNSKPRSRRADETREDYHKNTRGGVEPGVEASSRSAGGSSAHLSISQCPHISTDRTSWMASCYCRNSQTLIYRSSSDPVGQEVSWASGAGCRSISRSQVAPAHPSQQPTRFGNRCLQTIGRCWPHLRYLSVGGAGCSTQGLVAVVRSCTHSQVSELERITDLSSQVATELCKAGSRSSQTSISTHTPVSGQAILHFQSVCSDIRAIIVDVSVSDYFEEPDTQEAKHSFGEILSTLKVLQTRPGLCDVLQVKAEGFS